MKISERKQRLRARGIVPVPQETAHHGKVVAQPARGQEATRTGAKGAAAQRAARPRWQPSPTYQMGFGLLYIVFSPFLLITNWLALNAPALPHHAANHPGTSQYLIQLGMPVVFFLFGIWWFYRGFQARRRKQITGAPAPQATPTRKPGPAKRPSQ